MIRVFKIVALLIFAGVFLGGLWRGLTYSDVFKVQRVEVVGASKTTEERILKNSVIRQGESFWKTPVEVEAARIKQDSWVERVEVSRHFPGDVLIAVQEKKPVAVINNGRGRFKFVDSDSHVIDAAQPEQLGEYTVLSGARFEENQDLRSRAIALLKSLPNDGALSKNDVSELQFHDDHGFQVTLSKTGTVVDLGRDNIPLHIDRARRVVEYLNQHNINASHVDSDYAKKVLVKVRKGR